MADESDVETAIVGAVTAILYPSGQSGNPPISALGIFVKVYRGWPDQVTLDPDLQAGFAHVTVYGRPNMERNTNRYLNRREIVQPANPATYSLSSLGYEITVGGAAPLTPYVQNLCIFVAGKPYVAQSTGTQTAAQMASALQALIVVDQPGTTVSGAVITVPSPLIIGALRQGSTATIVKEVGRSQREFQITFWCSSPEMRDAAAKLVDPVLRDTKFLPLVDGTSGRLLYRASSSNDAPEKELLFRRDLFYTVEYPVTQTWVGTQIVTVSASIEDQFGDVIANQSA